MRDRRSCFMCFPSVVCVGKETTISIVPRDNSRRFRDGIEYEMCIFGLEENPDTYYDLLVYGFPCAVQDGCLTFTATFDSEQQYEIRFHKKGEKKDEIISLYAVEDDLYRLRPLKGDFHVHTYYSDGRDGIAMTPADYREEGFDFCAITDHNRRYPSVLASELYHDVTLGFHIIPGEEIHTPGSSLHIVHVGGTESVADRYVHHTEEFSAQAEEIEGNLPDTIPDVFRKRFALAKWACENIHACNGLAIFPHPYWKPRKYNVSDGFSDLLFKEKLFDAFELVGCTGDHFCNLQVGLWQQQLMQGRIIPVVGSSDSHNHNSTLDVFSRRFTIVFAKSNTTQDILDAVRNGYSVAGFIPRGENVLGVVPFNEGSVQFYGTQFRLVKFAHFLYQSYFAETRRLCMTEGVLMRRYAEGEEVGEILSALADTVANFYEKYYGIAPTPTVLKRISDFLDKAAEVQRSGPTTSGTSIVGNSRRE